MDKAEKPKSKLSLSGRKNLKELYEHASEEMYKRNLELAETNQALSLLRSIDKLVLESHNKLDALCQEIAKAVLDNSNVSVVAILAIPPRKDKLELLGFASLFPGVDKLHYQVALDDHNQWLVNPESSVIIDINAVSNETLAKLINIGPAKVESLRKSAPINSISIIKLVVRHRIVGVMAIGFTEHIEQLTDKQKAFVDRLSEAVGIAIENSLLFEENQYVQRKLQKTNEKLKSMDETKDEFISMASHQLRTPLTSVKGYLSMVLEGDAGDVNDNQRKLLDQAFVSSQRMVYLIADLLNVSRLRTGKFIIDAAPTNLADVVESEVAQLIEQAKAKNQTLVYNKPDNYPILMLDETKIRQVIMNFADNALFYTPSGGKIKIELTEDKHNIYFAVKDNGIGVPKNEQKHMFTKFYRAANARNARPDGTGLGLFMAKKVITSQDGNLLFESVEGKGSTFGFSFSKKHLKMPDPTDEPKA